MKISSLIIVQCVKIRFPTYKFTLEAVVDKSKYLNQKKIAKVLDLSLKIKYAFHSQKLRYQSISDSLIPKVKAMV